MSESAPEMRPASRPTHALPSGPLISVDAMNRAHATTNVKTAGPLQRAATLARACSSLFFSFLFFCPIRQHLFPAPQDVISFLHCSLPDGITPAVDSSRPDWPMTLDGTTLAWMTPYDTRRFTQSFVHLSSHRTFASIRVKQQPLLLLLTTRTPRSRCHVAHLCGVSTCRRKLSALPILPHLRQWRYDSGPRLALQDRNACQLRRTGPHRTSLRPSSSTVAGR